ncbi:hypothetical protein RHOSPDRAFT_35741 [Rhodotorula sp. JG-1b]|nr:hypothetical protein RHOSPDRAFT_35741 [Rhodotorula sp. JG-1b]
MQTRSAGILLAVVLIAYTLQTELASHVQHGLGYKKPYFLFYLTHSSYLLLFPLHLAALAALSRSASVPALLASLATTLEQKFQPPPSSLGGVASRKSATASSGLAAPSSPKPNQHVEHRSLFGFVDAVQKSLLVRVREPWIDYLAKRVLLLTLLISAPALSWYGAWAYLLSLYYLPAPAHLRTSPLLRILNFVAVLLAVTGVFVIAYGDTLAAGGADDESQEPGGYDAKNRLLGNALALFGSVAYAGYEVWYKLHISLPERSDDTPLQDLAPHSYEPAPTEDPEEAAVGADIETSSLLRAPSPSPAAADGYGVAGAASVNHDSELHSPLSASSAASSGSHAAHLRNNISTLLSPQTVSPTLLLLYSNAITSLIGLCTLVLLWIPIPLLHWIGWEEFQVPPKEAGLAMVGIILGGIVFNGGFMVLLSLWGPVTASVANLLTLLLVSLCDALFVPSAPPMTRSTLAGGGMIVCAFAVLIVAEMKGEGAAAGGDGGKMATTPAAGKERLARISEEDV